VEPVEKHRREKNSNMDESQASRCREKVEPRKNEYPWPENEAQPAALRNDPHDEQRKKQAARQTTQLLKQLHSTGRLLDLAWRQFRHLGKPWNHAHCLL
jgi:hypothetical protein